MAGKSKRFHAKVQNAKTGPDSLSANPMSATARLSAKKNITPFSSVGDAKAVPAGLEASLLRQGAGVEETAQRLNKFQGPWQNIPQAADDDNSLS